VDEGRRRKTKTKSPWREIHEKETVKEDKDDKEEKEDEVDDQEEASSSESSLESDEDSDNPAAAQPPSCIITIWT
jgi:hypothetical protein